MYMTAIVDSSTAMPYAFRIGSPIRCAPFTARITDSGSSASSVTARRTARSVVGWSRRTTCASGRGGGGVGRSGTSGRFERARATSEGNGMGDGLGPLGGIEQARRAGEPGPVLVGVQGHHDHGVVMLAGGFGRLEHGAVLEL